MTNGIGDGRSAGILPASRHQEVGASVGRRMPERTLTRPDQIGTPSPKGRGLEISRGGLCPPVSVSDEAGTAGAQRAPLPHGGVKPLLHQPWRLPQRGLAVFHGAGNVARLSHYFLPRLLLEGKRVLILDGANSADPRLIERFARERHVPFEQFNRGIQIARAFTCFQLTELIARVPKFLADFPAEVVIVTAFPDLYFDEDVRDWDARVAFEQGLRDLRPGSAGILPACGRDGRAPGCAALAVFSAIEDFAPPPARRRFFPKLCAAASEVWRFRMDAENRLRLVGAGLRPALDAPATRTTHGQPSPGPVRRLTDGPTLSQRERVGKFCF